MKHFKQEESILTELTALYESRGYKKYKPACFEEYSLYMNNRDFLISENVITFSGADGRLLALRPDVTLSIISRCKSDAKATDKLFYNEKVYRRTAASADFKEISQTGVEIIGNIDGVSQAEITMLILDTLSVVSENYILDVSHMGMVEGLISSFGLNDGDKVKVYTLLKDKNLHDFRAFAAEHGLDEKAVSSFERLANIGGNAKEAVKTAYSIALNERMRAAAAELDELIKTLSSFDYGDKININFSIVNDADYYNGIIFNGYIEGVPHSVLSGGRYDRLLKKFGKTGGAIGFALYLGELERYFSRERNKVDCLIIYGGKTQGEALKRSDLLLKSGKSVRLSREIPEDLRYGELVDLTKESSND